MPATSEIAKNQRLQAVLSISALVVQSILLVIAWPKNPGSNLELVFLAASALAMMVSAIVAISYSAWCIAIFLWLGLWLKFVVHLYYVPALVEPIGAFNGSLDQYNSVMTASAVAFLACAVSFSFGRLLRTRKTSPEPNAAQQFRSATGSQILIYSSLFACCLAVAIVNSLLGIFQVGIAPLTILPRPGNALISLFLSTGYFLTISYFIFCDWTRRLSIIPGAVTLILSAAVVSSSLLSRGVVVFHLASVILVLAGITWRQPTPRALAVFAGIVALSGAAFFATVLYVQTAREINFDVDSKDVTYSRLGVILKSATVVELNKTVQAISQLAVGRWIGVEGAMVAAGNPTNSPALMLQILSERSYIGKNSTYQYLSKSFYVGINGQRFQFATLPGPVGVFMFSGSVVYVFFGLAALCLLAMTLEALSQFLTQSEFATSFVAVSAASSVAQFGLTPVNQLPQITYLLIVLLGFWCARSIAPYLASTPLQSLLPASKPL